MSVTGEEVLKLAQKHVGERYVFGIPVPKDNWEWIGPWDCAELASWLVYQIDERLYGCDDDAKSPSLADAFTGYWARDAKSLGEIILVDQAARTPGAFVLRVPLTGMSGHIVISDGEGGTVEAHSTKRGVIESTLSERRWDMGVLIPGIDYGEGAPVEVLPPKTPIIRLTEPPMKGTLIRDIQRALLAKGFDPGPIDGSYGILSQGAVVAFQATNGLPIDGEIGPNTAKALGLVLPSAGVKPVRLQRKQGRSRRKHRK